MTFRHKMINNARGCTCEKCTFYPYFHYVKFDASDSEDIEYKVIRDLDGNILDEVYNHTTKEKHIYKKYGWVKVD